MPDLGDTPNPPPFPPSFPNSRLFWRLILSSTWWRSKHADTTHDLLICLLVSVYSWHVSFPLILFFFSWNRLPIQYPQLQMANKNKADPDITRLFPLPCLFARALGNHSNIEHWDQPSTRSSTIYSLNLHPIHECKLNTGPWALRQGDRRDILLFKRSSV